MLVLEATAAETLPPSTSRPGRIVLVVGPEGGVTPDERATSSPRAREVRMGPDVLRTSTAAAVAALLARTDRWA